MAAVAKARVVVVRVRVVVARAATAALCYSCRTCRNTLCPCTRSSKSSSK